MTKQTKKPDLESLARAFAVYRAKHENCLALCYTVGNHPYCSMNYEGQKIQKCPFLDTDNLYPILQRDDDRLSARRHYGCKYIPKHRPNKS